MLNARQRFNAFCALVLISAPAILIAAAGKPGAKTDFLLELDPRHQIERVRAQQHVWDQSLRGFRRAHHFATSLGLGSGYWRVGELGQLPAQSYAVDSYMARFNYDFHLQIFRRVGYFLGTSFGGQMEQFAGGQVKVDSAYALPGLVAGLTYNAGPTARVSFGYDHHMERFEGLRFKEAFADEKGQLSMTVNVSDWFIWLDFFYSLKWGVRLEAYSQKAVFSPINIGQQDTLLRTSFSKDQRWYGAGIVYHLI